MTKIKIAIGLLMVLVGGLLFIDHLQQKLAASQIEALRQIKIQADELAKVQLEQENKLNVLALTTVSIMQNMFGEASYYDYKLESGWSSEGHRVCASRTYKRGTTLIVRNIANDKEVECLVTDYGPDESVFPKRIIDLSSYAFSQIADTKLGVINVAIRPLNK